MPSIETVNSQLAAQLNIETNHAHTFQCLCARLYIELTAHTLYIFINRPMGVHDEFDSHVLKRHARAVYVRSRVHCNAPTMRSTFVRTMPRYVSAPLPSGPREPE